jgi:Na+/proline symporter
MVAQPHMMSNIAAAKTEMDSRVGLVGGMTLKRLVTVPWALTGVMAIAMYGGGKIEADHAFGQMAHDLLPVGFAGLMVACVLASVMDNAAVGMLTFAGLYTNNIHRRLFPAKQDEVTLLKVNRVSSLFFAALSIPLAYAFTDVPAAMRFTWNTVPLMGIPFFLGLCWRRANRYGALASFAAGFLAMLIANYWFGWTGDAGLPKSILLFLSTGVLAGVVTSLLTEPEPKRNLDRFYLLINTPIGEEHLLEGTGLVEVPGTQTYEPDGSTEGREIRLNHATILGDWGLEISKPSKEALWGAAVMAVVVIAMLGSMTLVSDWLAG